MVAGGWLVGKTVVCCCRTTGPAAQRPACGTIESVSQTHHLTQATYDRLAAELEELTTHGRTDIARKIQAARELGDLSENGDYHAAKEEQGKMEGRIRHLSAMLEQAVITEAGDGDTVTAGSIVVLCYEGEDDQERCLIGSIEERGMDADMVASPSSPLGSALMGARIGDIVSFESPAGAQKVEILDIEV
ncbi:MAG: transcription elongation factor GreA [Acidimicrobiia bacterium]|nr:transcription elongation factor GreA [Acidimicrobiia bacterium]